MFNMIRSLRCDCNSLYRAFHNVFRDYKHNKKTKGPISKELFTTTGIMKTFCSFPVAVNNSIKASHLVFLL
jgi:hypothetical protein